MLLLQNYIFAPIRACLLILLCCLLPVSLVLAQSGELSNATFEDKKVTISEKPAAEGNLFFVNYGIEEGLLTGSISDILQDEQGYIWIGTSNGLYRFDGYTFDQYKNDPKDPSTIAGNKIEGLHLDAKGRLWVGIDYSDLSCLDLSTGSFTNYNLKNPESSRKENRPMDVTSDKDGNIWIGMIFGGLKKLNPTTGEVKHFYVTDEYSERYSGHNLFIPCLEWDPDEQDKLWVGTYGGLFEFNITTEEFTFRGPDGKSNVKSIFFGEKNEMWIGLHARGFVKYNKKLDSWQHYPELAEWIASTSTAVNGIEQKSKDELWIGTPYGLGILNIKENSFRTIKPDPARKGTLSHGYITCLFKDKDGILWIGTRNGLNMLNNYNQLFKWYGLDDRYKDADNALYTEDAMLIDDNKVLVAAVNGNGVYVYDLNTLSWEIYPFGGNKRMRYIRDLFRTSEGETWAIGNGIYSFDQNKTSLKPNMELEFEEANLSVTEQWEWLQAKNEHHWVSVRWSGLYELDENKQPIKLHKYDENDPNGPHRFTLPRAIAEDSKGRVWLGTNMGLSYFDTLERKWYSFVDTAKGKRLTVNFISGIAEDKHGRIWAGTNGQGINCITVNSDKSYSVAHYFSSDGLADDYISDIKADRHGDLWINTAGGISYLNTDQLTFRNYTARDGLITPLARKLVVLDSNRLFVNAIEGFYIANFDTLRAKWPVTEPIISSFSVYNEEKSVNTKELKESGIRLRYNENFFSFGFSAFDFANSGETEYAFQLEGFDKDWNYTRRRFASYTNVPGGHYTFLLKSANRQGEWGEEVLRVPVKISKAIWESWWFYLLISLLMISIAYYLYKLRIDRLKGIMAVRNRIARDLHDDMGSTLSSISMLSEIAKHTQNTESVSKLVNSIGESSQEMLNAMDDIVWSVNPLNDEFGRLLVRMREFASEILEAKEIRYTFFVSPKLGKLKLDMDQRRDFYLVYKEAINNLAKYSMCKEAEIIISRRGNKLNLMVADDGVGFDLATSGKGNGLRNMRNRVQELSGTFDIDSKLGDGTRINMQIPVG